MTEDPNNQPDPPNSDDLINPEDSSKIATAQRQTLAALICAPVSLIIGGVLLSICSLVLAILSKSKIKKLSYGLYKHPELLKGLNRNATLALVISIVCLVLNAVSAFYFFNVINDILATGDLSQLQNIFNSSGSSGSGSSVWN